MSHVRAFALLTVLTAALSAGDGVTPQLAQYRLVFEATWSAETHPDAFPPGPHFSGLVGGTHDADVTFWQPGALASPGIEAMAELGFKGPLIQEVNAAIGAGSAGGVLSGGDIAPSPGSVTFDFTVTQQHPLVTITSMIAPSPDWFVGVDGLALFEDGAWVDSVEIVLWPWDAGTDSGASYLSPNADTTPADPIALITSGPIGNGEAVGTFTFTRLQPSGAWTNLGSALAGTEGAPVLVPSGPLTAGSTLTLSLGNAFPASTSTLVVGLSALEAPFKGGTLVPSVDLAVYGLPVDATGALVLTASWPAGVPSDVDVLFQHWVVDAGGPQGFAASNAVCATTP